MSEPLGIVHPALRGDIAWFQAVDRRGLPKEALRRMWLQLVWNAVHRKYPQLDDRRVADLSQWHGLDSNVDVDLDPSEQDVVRQFRVLRKIESTWRLRPLCRETVLALHGGLFGLCGCDVRWRTTSLDLEAGFVTPVPPNDISRHMAEYWELLSHASAVPEEEDVSVLLNWVVEIFARMVLIHPFPDGNGRTSRMMANLALRRWHLPYVSVPKVRNSPRWLAALQNAVQGRNELGVQCLVEWLAEAIQDVQAVDRGEH